MPEVAITVPVFDNTEEQFSYTQNIVQSILGKSNGDFSLTIVDNASPYPETRTYLRSITDQRFSWCSFGENRGYGVAINSGVWKGWEDETKFGIVMNNDILIQDSDWIETFIAPLRNDPKQLVGSRLISDNGLTDLFGGGPLPYLEGWALAFHSGLISDLARVKHPGLLFDPNYFAYYEDVDLSLIASRLGYKLTQNPAFHWAAHAGCTVGVYLGGPLLHICGITGYRTPSFDWQTKTKESRDYFVNKWSPMIGGQHDSNHG